MEKRGKFNIVVYVVDYIIGICSLLVMANYLKHRSKIDFGVLFSVVNNIIYVKQ